MNVNLVENSNLTSSDEDEDDENTADGVIAIIKGESSES